MNYIANSDFDKFISNILPTETENNAIISSHENVRKILESNDKIKSKLRKIVLTGSYKRGTNTKTMVDSGKLIDIDIAVIFIEGSFRTPQSVFDLIYNALDSHSEYRGKVSRQKRSIGIELSNRHIDVVPFQEVNLDFDKPLYISTTDKNGWELSNPICHIDHFIDVKKSKENFAKYVRAIKWWIKMNRPDQLKYPKGIAIEAFTEMYYNSGKNCVHALLDIMSEISNHPTIFLMDPCLTSNNLLGSDSVQRGFQDFQSRMKKSVDKLNEALVTKDIEVFRKYFGTCFPACDIVSDYLQEVKAIAAGIRNHG